MTAATGTSTPSATAEGPGPPRSWSAGRREGRRRGRPPRTGCGRCSLPGAHSQGFTFGGDQQAARRWLLETADGSWKVGEDHHLCGHLRLAAGHCRDRCLDDGPVQASRSGDRGGDSARSRRPSIGVAVPMTWRGRPRAPRPRVQCEPSIATGQAAIPGGRPATARSPPALTAGKGSPAAISASSAASTAIPFAIPPRSRR